MLAAAVAERKQAEDALRKSKAQIEAILQGVSDGVSVQDGTGRLVYAFPEDTPIAIAVANLLASCASRPKTRFIA